MQRSVVVLFLVVVSWSVLLARVPQDQHFLAPVERNAFASLTSYDSLQAFLKAITASPHISMKTIGTTRESRAVVAVSVDQRKRKAKEPRLRVLLFAQQHGDEPSGKEAMTLLLAKCASGAASDLLSHIELTVVPQMNPDGAERGQRRTSDGIDLNRSHLILSSPETDALHQFFYDWKPQVTLDVHEYGAYSDSWTAGGYVKRGDVQLGMLTNLNSSSALKVYQHTQVYPFVASRMARAGFAFNEYIVGSPQDRVRHSTTEINDGRQSFGILNTLSFIQEGRNGRSPGGNLERRVRSQLAGIEGLLEYCNDNAGEIRTLVAAEQAKLVNAAGRNFALRMEHIHGSGVLRIPAETYPGGRDTIVEITPYHDAVHAVCETTVPAGYCIPASEHEVIDLLQRHHVKMERVATPRHVIAETWLIDSVATDALEEDTLPRPCVRTMRETLLLKPGDIIVRTDQWHSLFLASMLEPESLWGLVKYEKFGGLLKGRKFPIARIPY
jgi:hypothetical protein